MTVALQQQAELADNLTRTEFGQQPTVAPDVDATSVRVALPEPDAEPPATELHHALRVFAGRIGEQIGLRFTR